MVAGTGGKGARGEREGERKENEVAFVLIIIYFYFSLLLLFFFFFFFFCFFFPTRLFVIHYAAS